MSKTVTVTLEEIKFAVIQEMEKSEWAELIDSMTFSAMVRFQYDTICSAIHGHVWGETGGHREIRYPRDWREAVKARWLGVTVEWIEEQLPNEILVSIGERHR